MHTYLRYPKVQRSPGDVWIGRIASECWTTSGFFLCCELTKINKIEVISPSYLYRIPKLEDIDGPRSCDVVHTIMCAGFAHSKRISCANPTYCPAR